MFVNPRQPQTLYISQILLYITAVGAVLFRSVGEGWVEALPLRYLVVALMTIGAAAGAYGIANSQKWGYQLGIAAAVAPFGIWGVLAGLYLLTSLCTTIVPTTALVLIITGWEDIKTIAGHEEKTPTKDIRHSFETQPSK